MSMTTGTHFDLLGATCFDLSFFQKFFIAFLDNTMQFMSIFTRNIFVLSFQCGVLAF